MVSEGMLCFVSPETAGGPENKKDLANVLNLRKVHKISMQVI
jgi:hypothetical protein